MVRIKTSQDAVTGIALSATLGLGVGVMFGMVLSELLGDVHSERVKGAVGRLRSARPGTPEAAAVVEQAIIDAIVEAIPGARIMAQALGNGIVELTGSVPTTAGRQLAGRIAQEMPSADVVVNRIHVADDAGHGERPRPPIA